MPTSEAPPRPVREFTARRFGPGAGVSLLAGDASSRAYFRINPGTGASVILVHHPDPFDAGTFPFLETTQLLADIGVRVPRVLEIHAEEGLLLLEDLGDDSLQKWVLRHPARRLDQALPLYQEAVEIIARLQQTGTPRLHDGLAAGRAALDGRRLRMELDFFQQHLIRGLHQATPLAATQTALEEGFEQLCTLLDHEPRVLCHRDFHSRNLMVQPARHLAVLDHQDARYGPDTYDLVSLLLDPYVTLPRDFVDRMMEHFLVHTGSPEAAATFRLRFHLMGVQRTLKAAGTFAAQKILHHNDAYLRYLPRALGLASESLHQCAALTSLEKALAPFLAAAGERQ